MIVQLNYDKAEVRALARGRWKYIFTQLTGLPFDFMDGRHHPCPNCGGKDRARTIDIENGVLFCNQCFNNKNGDGFSALVWLLGCSFSESVNMVGKLLDNGATDSQPVNLDSITSKKQAKPLSEQIEPLEADQAKIESWADLKPPIQFPLPADFKLCRWPRNAPQDKQLECIAFLSYRQGPDPAGMILYRLDGQDFPEIENGPGKRKTHLLRGSLDGLVIAGDLEAAHTVIKVEGVPDLLAFAPHVPDGYAVVTNTHGAKSAAKNCPLDPFNGKRVIIIGDADESGVSGAESLAREVSPYALEVKVIIPDGEIAERGGKDLRDVMNENLQAGYSLQDTVNGILSKAEQQEPYQPVDDDQDDDSQNETESTEYEDFPVQYLPDVLADVVRAGGESFKTYHAFIALPLLVMAAGMIGAARVLKPTKSWKVPATLWAAVIAEPGSMKTPTMKLATSPVYRLQAKAHAQNAEKLEQHEKRKAIYEIRYKEWLKEVARGEGPPPDEPEKPDDPRIIDKILGDVTFERLPVVFKNNPKGITIVRDELSGLFGSLNKYSGAKGADEAVLLEGHNLGTGQVHRRHDPHDIFIQNISISLYGGIQTGIFRRLMSSNYRESGLMARLLVAHPPRRFKSYPGEGVPEETINALNSLFESLDTLQPAETEPGVFNPIPVYVSKEAGKLYREFHTSHNTEAMTMKGDRAAAWSKLEETPLRIALIFHCIECATSGQNSTQVSPETMYNAIQVTDWLKKESLRVYRLFDSEDDASTEQQEKYNRLIGFLKKKGEAVSVRDVQRGLSFKTSQEAEKALGELVQTGAAEWVNKATNSRGPSPRLVKLRHIDTLTDYAETSDLSQCVRTESENQTDSDCLPVGSTSEQEPQGVPESLGDYMEYFDDEAPF